MPQPKIKMVSVERVFSEQNGQVIDNKLIEKKLTNKGITVRGFDNGRRINITRKFRKHKKAKKSKKHAKTSRKMKPQMFLILP